MATERKYAVKVLRERTYSCSVRRLFNESDSEFCTALHGNNKRFSSTVTARRQLFRLLNGDNVNGLVGILSAFVTSEFLNLSSARDPERDFVGENSYLNEKTIFLLFSVLTTRKVNN